MPIFDKNISRIAMKVYRSGKHPPIIWYSIIKYDYKDDEFICKDMLDRFSEFLKKNPAIRPTINVIQFYEKNVKIAECKA